jgi:hypothetical protein
MYVKIYCSGRYSKAKVIPLDQIFFVFIRMEVLNVLSEIVSPGPYLVSGISNFPNTPLAFRFGISCTKLLRIHISNHISIYVTLRNNFSIPHISLSVASSNLW